MSGTAEKFVILIFTTHSEQDDLPPGAASLSPTWSRCPVFTQYDIPRCPILNSHFGGFQVEKGFARWLGLETFHS